MQGVCHDAKDRVTSKSNKQFQPPASDCPSRSNTVVQQTEQQTDSKQDMWHLRANIAVERNWAEQRRSERFVPCLTDSVAASCMSNTFVINRVSNLRISSYLVLGLDIQAKALLRALLQTRVYENGVELTSDELPPMMAWIGMDIPGSLVQDQLILAPG